MIGCEHWQDCGVAGGGCCEADIYRRPSFGVCTQCPVNTSNPSPLTVDEYLAERDRDAGAARDKPRSPSLLSKVVSYAKAEASMILSGPLPDVAYDARMRVCQKCEHLELTDDDIGHCTKCGCGNGSRAALTVKGRMPAATCPLDKWPEFDPGAEE